MIIRSIRDTASIQAGDASVLKELLHPAKAALAVRYSLAHAEVAPGQTTRPHRLAASEVYYILEGRGRMHIDAEEADVAEGQAVYIPPGAAQFIENPGPGSLKFLCLVDPAWTPEGEKIL
jgi:mannose-6-phosphate isomerase-like protein (cupin superfamily)